MKNLYPTIDKERFIELTSGPDSSPFLVVFTATWLGEGIILDEIIRRLSEDCQEVFGFYRIDVEASKDLAAKMGIHRLPSILFFQNGEMTDKFTGLKPGRFLKEKIEAML